MRIVPVGLNYFRGQGHRFRKRVVVEFGAPIRINPAMYEVYKEKKNRRQAYQMLLSAVEDGMKAVVVTARTYDDLKLIHTLRRLYQKASDANTLKDKQVLSRKFSIAHRMILDANNGELPPDLAILRVILALFLVMITSLLANAEQAGGVPDAAGRLGNQRLSGPQPARALLQDLLRLYPLPHCLAACFDPEPAPQCPGGYCGLLLGLRR